MKISSTPQDAAYYRNLGLYTNERYSLYDRFKDILRTIDRPDIYFYGIAGYFNSSAYFALRDSINSCKKIKILIGISADRLSAYWNNTTRERRERMIREYAYESLCRDIEEARYSGEVERGIKEFVQDLLDDKLELRYYGKKIVHAKMYLFLPENWTPDSMIGTMISGSSNFTAPGLGTSPEYSKTNYELNIELKSAMQLEFAKAEFDRLWAEGVTLIPAEVEEHIKKRTYLLKKTTPAEVFYKFLYEYFRDSIEYDSRNVELIFPLGFKRLSYQIDAVNEGLALLEKHNGFFLADVVGLGKTVVTVLLLRSYMVRLERTAKVLIIAPPAILPGWRRTLTEFGIEETRTELVSSGNLGKIRDRETFSLVIVDEAHNFRNSDTDRYRELERITKGRSRYGRRKVILISATPLNNQPRELLNLLALFQDTRNSTLPVSDLVRFFSSHQKEYEYLKRQGVSEADATERIKAMYKDIREKVLSPVIIRRTRSDLNENPEYKNDLISQGIRFPEPQKPRIIHYDLDSDVDELYTRTLEVITSGFYYANHRRLSYLRGEKADRFNLPENTFSQLSTLMKQFFLKRLDSSFHALTVSLERFSRANAALLTMLDNDEVYLSASVDVTEYILSEDIEGLLEELEQQDTRDPTITLCSASDFTPEFRTHLERDRDHLAELLMRWKAVSFDPKLEAFADRIDSLLKPEKNPGERLVVFSESEETVKYVEKYLVEDRGRTDVLAVSAANRDSLETAIRADFDANFPGGPVDQFRVIISTDVLAEGVNLHRANTIINYDTPWNSVKLFQRVGRVNRVGSRAEKIYIYNFFPQPKIEASIELQKKAKMKLQAFHSAFGEDAQIYSSDEEVQNFSMYGAGGPDDDDRPDLRLKYLLEMRELRRNDPGFFERIAKLPLKLTCRRNARTPDWMGASFLYLRTTERDAFFRVKDDTLSSVSFFDAVGLLKPDDGEVSIEGECNLTEQADKCEAEMRREAEEEAFDATRAVQLGPNENAAVTYLNGFLESLDVEDLVTQQDRDLIRRCLLAIRNGRVPRRLCSDIAASWDNAKRMHLAPVEQVKHIRKLLHTYDIHLLTDEDIRRESYRERTARIERPAFVLGELFGEGDGE